MSNSEVPQNQEKPMEVSANFFQGKYGKFCVSRENLDLQVAVVEQVLAVLNSAKFQEKLDPAGESSSPISVAGGEFLARIIPRTILDKIKFQVRAVLEKNEVADAKNAELKKMKSALNKCQGELKKIERVFENIQVGVVEARISVENESLEKKYLYANPAFCEIFGLDAKKYSVRGENLKNLGNDFPPEVRAKLQEKDAELFQKIQENPEEVEKGFSQKFSDSFLDSEGKMKYLCVDRFCKKVGEEISVHAAVRDETKLHDALEKLRVAVETKDNFFNIIAHDLKSPFNSILGLAEILSDDLEEYTVEEQKKMLQAIFGSAKNAVNLIENLLNWARAQSGKIEIQNESFSASTVCKNVTSLLAATAEQKKIKILENSNGAVVFTDKKMLETVLRNLISNAIKFSPEGKNIVVSVEKNETGIQFSVKDSGVGMSSEKKETLFVPGENESTPGTNNESGTGLGMLLCDEFVKTLGGKIWVESAEGAGSTFYFTIPDSKDSVEK